MRRTVVIDCFPESVGKYRNGHAIVAVDVIRATTTAVTAVVSGRRCFPVATLDQALSVASTLAYPVLAGELGGSTPYGFDMTNSPAEIDARRDVERPMVLLSTSGTHVICAAGETQPTFAACLRNYSAQAAHLAAHHSTVAVIGAGSRGEFREEDALCCAWIAARLLGAGYDAADQATLDHVERWRDAPVEAVSTGKSADYLRKTNQCRDLEFVLTHVDDLDLVFPFRDGEVRKARTGSRLTWRRDVA